MGAPAILLLSLLLLERAMAQAQPAKAWNSKETQHFLIYHEKMGFSLSDHERIERIYQTLHPELWSLVPWMDIEKTSIYLYRDQESYLQGSFNPPPWSGGLFSVTAQEKALAIYEPVDIAIVAHELTHLYFHTFFAEKQVHPPAWLNEGLAGMLQGNALTSPDPRDKGPILKAPIPLAEFFRMQPGNDALEARVSLWYRQSHSVVRFVKRGHIEASFTEFCKQLRNGEELESALSKVYGYPDLGAFEAAWLRWRPKKPIGQPVGLENN